MPRCRSRATVRSRALKVPASFFTTSRAISWRACQASSSVTALPMTASESSAATDTVTLVESLNRMPTLPAHCTS